MKKYRVAFSALLVCGACYAAQDTTLTQSEVRDPRRLETILEANFTDAETRLAATEAGTSISLASNKVFIGNSSGKASEKTISGLFSITTNGVASATSTAAGMTNASATVVVTPQAPAAVTPTVTLTAQSPGAQTPAITITKQAPSVVTPIITLTPQTGAITATATPTLQTPGAQTPTITVTLGSITLNYLDATTNPASLSVVTGLVSATSSALPNFPTNLTIAVNIVGGDAVWTNATAASSALPEFMTNATASSSALPDFPTNYAATCSALPLFATNATAEATVTSQTTTFVKP